MENLRWILIFAGVAILLALWFSGRAGRRGPTSSAPDPLLGEDRAGNADDRLDNPSLDDAALDDIVFDDHDDAFADIDPDGTAAPRDERPPPLVAGSARAPRAREGSSRERLPVLDPDRERGELPRGESPRGQPMEMEPPPAGALGGLTQKFEAIGARLAPKRRQRVAASEPEEEAGEGSGKAYATKIVTLHVVAPEGSILPPEALHEMFERRGYHHGDMSIFHSLYEGRTVFSIARMVKPGTFDPDDLSSFETPGLALILQLPGPVAADTAFEVMLSEAFDIAGELGGAVLDANRSTLGRQTEQHLREGIYEYMHRQKYFDSVV